MKKTTALRKKFQEPGIVRIVGAHNGLGAKLIEQRTFDGVWASGLEISTSHALPDANILTMTENLDAARAINEAMQLPVVCDCDTGYGNASQVMHMVKRYEAAGLAAVVIEDKRFPKVNSLIAARQDLASIEEFAGKIEAAKSAQQDPDFMVFARIEALIAGWGMEEALRRSEAYVEAGADGIVIHSKSPTPDEIFEFAQRWNGKIPLVAIPTTYSQVTAKQLEQQGFQMVIYANHALRAAIRAVSEVLQVIDETGSTAAIEGQVASLKEVFELQGLPNLKEEEKRFGRRRSVQAVIPAARDNRFQPDLKELLNEKPLCMLEIGGKTLLERQTDLLRSCAVEEITVVGGYKYDKIQAPGAKLLYNPDYETGHCVQSIMLAKEQLQGESLVVYSDILFDRQILDRLLTSPYPITLVVDRAFQRQPYRNKLLDLVVADSPGDPSNQRYLRWSSFKSIRQIGQKIVSAEPTHEFIGMVYFRPEGALALREAWEKAQTQFRGKSFYEALSVEQADLTDLIHFLLDQNVPIAGMEVEQGWSEIHSMADVQRVNSELQQPHLFMEAQPQEVK